MKKEIKEFIDQKKIEEKLTKDQQDKEKALLTSHRKSFKTYNYLIAELLLKNLKAMDWPIGWRYIVAPTKIGVVMELQSPDHRFFRDGFKPTGEAEYDLNAVALYLIRAENTIDTWTEKKNSSKSSSN